MSFVWHRPTSVAEAVAIARAHGEAARFIAGGTDLVIQMNRKRLAAEHVIDLTPLQELSGIEEDSNGYTLGALTTHKAIERHAGFQGALAALAEAARVVGGHQVRNVGTVGGNIVNASPAADVVVSLLALDALLTLIGPDATRTTKLEDFLLGPGSTTRMPDELLRSIRFATLPPRSATAFLKVGRRKAMEISVVCIAVRLTLGADDTCRDVRIALGAVGATALHACTAGRALAGQPATDATFQEAGRLAVAECAPISDVRASAHYRRIVVEALVPRALRIAATRADGVAP